MANNQKRQQLLYTMLNQIVQTGFAGLKMDDFVKMVPASRSTVYRYFKSRDDIISEVVDEYINYIESFKLPEAVHDQQDWLHNVEEQLEESLILNSHLSPVFLQDLAAEFPADADRLQATMADHDAQLLRFYRAGQTAKVFNPTKAELWILEDRLMIPKIIDPAYLVSHNLTIHDAITSYVAMKCDEIIQPQYRQQFDASFTTSIIQKMSREIAR